MERIRLIVEGNTESGDEGGLWGRVTYDDNLIVEHADTVDALRESMKTLLYDFHGVTGAEFDLVYDLYAFFEHYAYLKVSKIAEYAGMNAGLLRHYKSGSKHPSAGQVQRIEAAVHRLAKELADVHLAAF